MSDNNRLPPQEIGHEELGRLIVLKGWDQAVLYCRREDGAEQVVHVGRTYKHGRIAEDMASFLKASVFGWEQEASARASLDAEVAAAKREMAEGPDGGDPNTGMRLIGEKLEMKAGEKKVYLPSIKKKDRK